MAHPGQVLVPGRGCDPDHTAAGEELGTNPVTQLYMVGCGVCELGLVFYHGRLLQRRAELISTPSGYGFLGHSRTPVLIPYLHPSPC